MPGATDGDAIIALLAFAKEAPWTFVLTVPGAMGLALVIMVLVLKVVVIGPLTQRSNETERERRAERERGQQRLPLEGS